MSEHKICEERYKQLNKKVDDVEKRMSDRVDGVEEKMAKMESKVINIDKTLGERINTLEITMKLSTESTNNKIDKLDRKLDKVLEDKEEEHKSKAEDSKDIIKNTNDTWAKIVLELIKALGVVGGIIAGIKLLG